MVRDALRRAEAQGLIASHHFFLTFKTHFPGVDIPDFLRDQYPAEMTIILQHQFWGLKVRDDRFEVTLSFRKLPATLTIPFAALTAFMDPGVEFGLQFKGSGRRQEAVCATRRPRPPRSRRENDKSTTAEPAKLAPDAAKGRTKACGPRRSGEPGRFRKK